MRNLDYDLLRSTSPPSSRVATPTLIPTHNTINTHATIMSQRASGVPSSPSSPTLPHSSSHAYSFSTPLPPDSISSSSSASPFRDPTSTPLAPNSNGRHPSRASSVSSVASVAAGKIGPKISPAPTTVKQKHYWNYYHSDFDMETSTSAQIPQGLMRPDDIVTAAVGGGNDDLYFGPDSQGADAAPPPPPAPPPVRYTRTGQVIPEGKVMMVNGGCVGEGDWKRTNGAIQSMFEPLHHVLTHEGKVPLVLPSNGFWLRAMTDQAVLELCRAYDIEPDPEGDARKNRAAFLNYLGATYLAAVV